MQFFLLFLLRRNGLSLLFNGRTHLPAQRQCGMLGTKAQIILRRKSGQELTQIGLEKED
jgi:hypothetical protein